jgi:hypothetical protein
MTLHFDAEVAVALEIEAKRRGLTLARAANDIVRRALIDEASEKLADTVKARLDRLDRREQARAREAALLKETLLLFIRTWFEYAGAPPEGDPDDGADAEARFAGFLDLVAAQM